MEAEKHWARHRRILGTLTGFALAGVVGAGLLASRPPADGRGDREKVSPTLEVPTRRLNNTFDRRLGSPPTKLESTWLKSQCHMFPWLKFLGTKPLYSNLANKGPDSGQGEGIIYRTLAVGTGWGAEEGRVVRLVLHATNADYKPFSPRMNGRQAFYGSVNLQSGSHLDITITFMDEKTMKPLKLDKIAMSFFDLDEAHFQRSQESVAIDKFREYYVTPNTETRMSTISSSMYKFSASTFGDGTDNPHDPSSLTSQQKNRAVTFLYENIDEVHVTVAASPNTEVSPRFFTFVMRPSLLCAVTLTAGAPKPLGFLDYNPPLEYALNCGDHMYFERWLKRVGDKVEVGDGVAIIKDKSGRMSTVKATKAGYITKTLGIMQGDSCDTRMMGSELAVVKMERLQPLQGTPAAQAKPGWKFVKFLQPVGKVVPKGTPLVEVVKPVGPEATCQGCPKGHSTEGEKKILKAPHEGYISAEQGEMQEGDPVELASDDDLVAFGKLKPLPVKPGEGPATGPTGGTWLFKEWTAEVGDRVEKGDPIAVLENNQGEFKTVKASKEGSIISRQEELAPGYKIANIMEDSNLAVIGKYDAMEPEGWREEGVKAPENAIFKEWKVHKGDHIEAGDTIAVVQYAGRRLEDGRILMSDTPIPSPAWGTVTKEQPLKPGVKIGDQMLGPNIATIDKGMPWWTMFLVGLSTLCCCLCCLFFVMAKPKPAYTPMPPVEEPPPAPDGLRLDFEENGEVHTVYAKWRPLGIKHEDVAPIIAHEFTINSYAKDDLGVKKGWKLRRIGDEELEDNPNFGEVNSKLHDWMKDFPLWPLPMVFSDGGVSKDAKFVERPIGIEFSNSAPIKVTTVYEGSPAAEQGITEGMTVTKIGEADVRDNTDFRKVMEIFYEGVQPLDHQGKTYK